MKSLLTNLAVSVTDLKKSPASVLEEARGRPVAVMNRNDVVAYLVPAEAVTQFEEIPMSQAVGLIDKVLSKNAIALDNLKDR